MKAEAKGMKPGSNGIYIVNNVTPCLLRSAEPAYVCSALTSKVNAPNTWF
jgi:hypothetical protein